LVLIQSLFLEQIKNFRFFGIPLTFHGTVVMGMALWGTVLGAIFGGIPTNKIGRRILIMDWNFVFDFSHWFCLHK
jgi:hypothetical protein